MMKPLLAGKIDDVENLTYPLLATPKVDGIRCLTTPEGHSVSRTLKDIPNEYIWNTILHWSKDKCFDGELWVRGAKNFGEVSKGVMRKSGEPDFEYIVFDIWDKKDWGYSARMVELNQRTKAPIPRWLRVLNPVHITTAQDLLTYEQQCLEEGYEGVMTRSPAGVYKNGRSTVKEEILLKLKRFTDSEARIIGFEEQMHNMNEAKKNALGRTERSSAKAGKVPAGVLGKFKCVDRRSAVEFEVGTGFDAAQRAEYWKDRNKLVGKYIKYKYQKAGAQEKPRFPVFLGFRHRDDM